MSKIHYSKVIIIDLEGTCYENMTRAEQLMKTKIIQIGVSELDLTSGNIKTKNYFIKCKEKLTDYCVNLTKITDELLQKEGMELARAIKLIKRDFVHKNVYWGAWGDDNLTLKQACEQNKLEIPFDEELYYNFQDLYSLKTRRNQTVNLDNALKENNIEFTGIRHRADADAENTAKLVYNKILNNK